MGFSYNHLGLCCDFCSNAGPKGNVRKIACPYGYCQAWACCETCKKAKCSTCKKNMIFEISIGSKFAFVCRQWDCKDMRTDEDVKALVQRMESMQK